MRGLIQANGFGPFYADGVEILRRIFVTVRDRHWREIAPTRWDLGVDEGSRSITVAARHVSEAVDFAWQGVMRVAADGRRLKFWFEGEAKRTLEVCRLGLVVLHPVEEMVGARVGSRGPEGVQTMQVSRVIAPQPMVDGRPCGMMRPFTSLAIERGDIGLLELALEGDLFEMEDQRNWGDASFKTYCTPLALGFPRRVEKGSRIAQGVDVVFTPTDVPDRAVRREAARRRAATGIFPTVGYERAGSVAAGGRELDWHHVKAEFSELEAAGQNRGRHESCGLEIALEESFVERHSREVLAKVSVHRSQLRRILLYGAGVAPPSIGALGALRGALDAVGLANVPVFAATRGHFVEFNRSAAAGAQSAAGISFPLSATVHAQDPRSIAENVGVVRDIATTARQFAASIAITPLALHHPPSAGGSGFPPSMIAPWLTATLVHAAVGGVESVTLAGEITGKVATELLERLARCAGTTVTLIEDQASCGVYAALLREPVHGTAQLLGVNLSAGPERLLLDALAPRLRSSHEARDARFMRLDAPCIEIPAYGVRWLECNWERWNVVCER